MQELLNSDLDKYIRAGFMTVADLQSFIAKHNIPATSPVLIQRVEDVYYEKNNWRVYRKVGEHTFKDKDGSINEDSLEQYTPAWSCVHYNDDQNILFIDLHY
jgi:hypothetical protein